jgi:TolB-like protein/DNA-binding winged helix-turn-helix (wHTH) protein/Tfp pilus assembly protein PilF
MAHNSHDDSHLFVFGAFTLDSRQRDVVALEPKVVETLLALVESAGRALTKDELLSRIWPDAFVEEGSLTRNISTLRKVLASDGNPHGYIETLSRRGYRFQPVVQRVAADKADGGEPVSASETEVAPSTPEPPAHAPVMLATPSRRRWLPLVATAAATVLMVGVAAARWHGSSAPPSIKSIAVLPLDNFSGDPAQEFFSDGMTEAVISKLAQGSTLRVTSRTSVMGFKGTSKSIPEIGRQLGVDAIVEGSVQRAGDRVRVNVQLINAATDSHVWAKEFESRMPDVLDLQRRIAVAIASELSQLAPSSRALGDERRIAPDAYDAYLLGTYLFWKSDFESPQRAVAEFRKAIALEPDFAEAHAGLARALAQLAGMGLADTAEEGAKEARRAVALDEHLSEAHVALAAIAFETWDWQTTEREYKRGLELLPNVEDACACWSLVLSAFGRHDEAIAWADALVSRNPLSAAMQVAYAAVLLNARKYAEAERRLNLALELEPNGWGSRIILGQVYKVTGRAEQGIPLLSAPVFANSAILASAYAAAGRRAEALEIVKKVEPHPKPGDLLSIAMVYFDLGDRDRGFQWLERAVARRVGFVRWLNVHPAYDPLRSDPRFIALVNQLQLPAVRAGS